MRALHLNARERATTLLETVVVAGIVSLIVIFTLGVIPSFKMSNRRANMELQAGALAQSRLEQLRILPFENVESTAFPDVTADGVTYQTLVSKSEPVMAGTPPAELSKKIRVEVVWLCKDRQYKTFRETILCKLLRS